MQQPGEITLVPVGPLTNIALALMLEPRIVERVAGVVIMGGAGAVNGNVNPAAEANIWHDPHAADRVFTAGWPLIMAGLDVTEKTTMDEPYFLSLRTSRTGEFLYDISRFYLEFHRQVNGVYACHTHDPSAIAYLLEPDALHRGAWPCAGRDRRHRFRADALGSPRGMGRSQRLDGQRSVGVCVDVDSERLLTLYRERIWPRVKTSHVGTDHRVGPPRNRWDTTIMSPTRGTRWSCPYE